tara:strand:+ start:94 stop:402 length:309 start_codon:yes stop_codon:yes gene_type:complete
MTDIKEYVENCLKEDKLIIKCEYIPHPYHRFNIKVTNVDEIIKWRKRNGITQKDMVKSNILGIKLRAYQILEADKNPLPLMVIKYIKQLGHIGLEFVEEDNA